MKDLKKNVCTKINLHMPFPEMISLLVINISWVYSAQTYVCKITIGTAGSHKVTNSLFADLTPRVLHCYQNPKECWLKKCTYFLISSLTLNVK